MWVSARKQRHHHCNQHQHCRLTSFCHVLCPRCVSLGASTTPFYKSCAAAVVTKRRLQPASPACSASSALLAPSTSSAQSAPLASFASEWHAGAIGQHNHCMPAHRTLCPGKFEKKTAPFPTVFGALRPGMLQLDLPCRSLQTENRNIDSATCPQKNSPYDAKKLYRGEDSLFQKPSLFPLYPFLLTMALFFPAYPGLSLWLVEES